MTESKRDNAKVEVETAIRLDKKELDRSGMTISSQNPEGTHVSPMAGKLCCWSASQSPLLTPWLD